MPLDNSFTKFQTAISLKNNSKPAWPSSDRHALLHIVVNITKNCKHASHNSMFFETSILNGFWEGFTKGLGGQNPRFSDFFRCFVDVILQEQGERRKNRKKVFHSTNMVQTWPTGIKEL